MDDRGNREELITLKWGLLLPSDKDQEAGIEMLQC